MFGDYNLNVFSMKEPVNLTLPSPPHMVHIWVASFISLYKYGKSVHY